MKYAALLLLAAAAGCEDRGFDARWFAQPSWEDGKAVVSVFKGRWKHTDPGDERLLE